jgi:hypothetical protein
MNPKRKSSWRRMRNAISTALMISSSLSLKALKSFPARWRATG